jgi:BolA protein
MKSRIIETLTNAFSPTLLIVEDTSESHKGHAGYKEGGGTHFNVKIRAKKFTNMSRVEAHRTVMLALSSEFNDKLHALSLDVRGD